MGSSTEPGKATAPSADSVGGTGKAPARRRRWPIALLAALVVLAAVGYGAVKLAPNYIARSLVRTYFQGLAIDTSGVETIDIDLLHGKISFGPVTFAGKEGEPGEVGRISADLSVRRLFSRQALIQQAAVEGMRIDVRQAADGALSINGVPLTRILAERAAAREAKSKAGPAPPPPEPAGEKQPPWGVGLDQLKLHDSWIVFTSVRGGKATIAVDELDLEGFATWSPDEPGRIRLNGNLNDIHIALSGTATPFADNIGIDAALQVSGVEIGKIETYTGGLGFDRGDGRIDVDVSTNGSKILSDGRIDAHLAGKASLAAFDLAHQKFGSLKLATGALSLDDIRLLYDPAGDIELTGSGTVSADGMDARLHDGTEVGLDGAVIGLPGLHVLLPHGGQPKLTAAPQLDVRSLHLGGRHVQGTADGIAIRLSEFAVDGGEAGKPMTATGTVAVQHLALLLPLKKPIRIGGEAISLDAPGMTFAFGERTLIDGPLGLDLSSFGLSVLKRASPAAPEHSLVDIAAGRITGPLSTLSLDDAPGLTQVKVATPSLTVERFRLGAPVAPGQALEIASSMTLRSTDIGVADGPTLDVSGTTNLGAPKFSVIVGGAGDRTAIEFAGFTFNPQRFAYREIGANSDFAFRGRIDADRAAARLLDESAGTASVVDLGRLHTSVADMAMDIDNPSPQWHARHLDLDLDLASLSAAVPGSLSMMLDLKNVSLADGIAASQGRGEYGFERLAVGHADATLTQAPRQAASVPVAANPSPPKVEKAAGHTWPPADLPVVRIGRFGLTNGARIVLLDQTRSPPASSTVQVETFGIENIDTTRPDARSNLRLKARLDQGTLTADGWGSPFQRKPAFDLRANVQDLLLPGLSPYLGPKIGLDIIDGRLTANAEATAEAGRLGGEVRATVFNLGFADRPGDRAGAGSDEISRSVGVPLTTIIGLLEDADGSIRITLPFEGDLSSPDFDYSKMIWNGIFRVLRALVVSPFKLISASLDLAAAKREGRAAAAAAPEASIAFAPGEAAIGSEAQGALLSLQQVLKDRPKMQLRLCGIATPADGTALGLPAATPGQTVPPPPLLDLARERMTAVQQALMEGSGADRSRLPLCPEPLVSTTESGLPRVEMGF